MKDGSTAEAVRRQQCTFRTHSAEQGPPGPQTPLARCVMKSPVNVQQPEPLSAASGNYEQEGNLRSLTGT